MKRMTLFSLLDRYCVLIPALQRNYVHGRADAHAKEVREHFVASLEACCTTGGEVNLDLVYGILDKDVLIPIDGQQRLTTLWLAAVYAVNASAGGKPCLELLSALSRFSYASRPLASTFCRWLTSGAPIDFGPALTRADDCWGDDPTVRAMITTLRLIHEQFLGRGGDLLAALRGDKVHFEFAEVHGNATDLYVKINARGKQLTQWENFKGEFARHLASERRGAFESQIETWSDRYFELFKETPDGAFFSMFGRVADYVLRTRGSYDANRHENLSALAKGIACYVPLEEFDLCNTADCIVVPVLRMLRWALNLNRAVSLWYWEEGEKSRSAAEALFAPRNENERDFALFLFEYFLKYEDAKGLSEHSFRGLRFVANVLENVAREQEMKSGADSYSPAKQFNRVKDLAGFLESGPGMYDARFDLSDNAPIQYREEEAKGRIYGRGTDAQIGLLQSCESYMHGRMRMALFSANETLDGWSHAFSLEKSQERMTALKQHINDWCLPEEGRRVDLLKLLVDCEPWAIKSPLKLATDMNALRDALTTQDDVYLQRTYLDGDNPEDLKWKTNCPWRRDWRKNVFEVDDWQGRTVKWHGGTGTFFLYQRGRTNVQWALPVADWRFDIRSSIGGDFAELGKVDSVCSNDGGKRSFRCEWEEIGERNINIYLWKEGVEIRWFKRDGKTQKSEWIEINGDKVDGAALACEIKRRIKVEAQRVDCAAP